MHVFDCSHIVCCIYKCEYIPIGEVLHFAFWQIQFSFPFWQKNKHCLTHIDVHIIFKMITWEYFARTDNWCRLSLLRCGFIKVQGSLVYSSVNILLLVSLAHFNMYTTGQILHWYSDIRWRQISRNDADGVTHSDQLIEAPSSWRLVKGHYPSWTISQICHCVHFILVFLQLF